MIELELTIPNKLGLHARSAAKLGKIASRKDATILLSVNGDDWVDTRNIMALMTLAAKKGTKVQFQIEGDAEAATKAAVIDLFERKFDED